MGTARSTNAETPAKPRKRAPRKTTPVPSRPAADEPPPAEAEDSRIAKLRRMLADEGLDPDVILAGQPAATATPPKSDVIEGEVVVSATGYPADFEPIDGVGLEGLRQIVVDARRNPATADTIINGIRTLIVENGHDPDRVIAAAFGEETGDKPATRRPDGLVNAVVDFRGRPIEVSPPEIEQVMVIRRMQSLFANAAKMKEITADEAIRLMDRALKAVCSVVINPDDVEFLEDLLITREATIEDMLPLLSESMEALKRANADNGNREDRRKAARSSSGRTGRAALDTSGG